MADDVAELVRLREMISGGTTRTIRERVGLSLGDVARTLGVSPSCVHRWEHGVMPRDNVAHRYFHLLLALQDLTGRQP